MSLTRFSLNTSILRILTNNRNVHVHFINNDSSEIVVENASVGDLVTFASEGDAAALCVNHASEQCMAVSSGMETSSPFLSDEQLWYFVLLPSLVCALLCISSCFYCIFLYRRRSRASLRRFGRNSSSRSRSAATSRRSRSNSGRGSRPHSSAFATELRRNLPITTLLLVALLFQSNTIAGDDEARDAIVITVSRLHFKNIMLSLANGESSISSSSPLSVGNFTLQGCASTSNLAFIADSLINLRLCSDDVRVSVYGLLSGSVSLNASSSFAAVTTEIPAVCIKHESTYNWTCGEAEQSLYITATSTLDFKNIVTASSSATSTAASTTSTSPPPFVPPEAISPQLIFTSGFEPNVQVVDNGYDIAGLDSSTGMAWRLGLERWENITTGQRVGYFALNYGGASGGNSSQRLAEITQDPVDPLNSVLKFWILEANNVIPNPPFSKGRVQANVYSCDNLFYVYNRVRLFIPNDFDVIRQNEAQMSWLIFFELWNNVDWAGYNDSFRINLLLEKAPGSGSPFTLRVNAEDMETRQLIWSHVNGQFQVPLHRWMTLGVLFIEGNETSGRFKLDVTIEGEATVNVFDVHNYTYSPFHYNEPLDGMRRFNPMKLYSHKNNIDQVRQAGKLFHVLWDDWELWTDLARFTPT